ncbi:MAG: excalibur calcium-binding domain-containing protein [Alphaproteobacteria bacterium]|nr:excalibur calcium-binding domain-containing protein [Alphaproteobacteria bacterium]
MKYFWLFFLFSTATFGYTCVNSKKYCSKIKSCSEAYYYYKQCGQTQKDRDNDGIPCENVCGKTIQEMKFKLNRGD